MRTPVDMRKSPARRDDVQVGDDAMRSVDESSEDSIDEGSYGTGKYTGANDGVGWFHAKITVGSSIHWANNYKIQAMMFLIFICGVATTIVFADNSINASVGLLAGSVITLLSCASVVYTFLTRPTWRKHPNPIIFFRSLCDIGLVSVLLISELYKCAKGDCSQSLTGASCSSTAALTQFFLWSSESWFFVMAIDMLSSLQSPFTDYKRNVRRYHGYVWMTGECLTVCDTSPHACSADADFVFQHWRRPLFSFPSRTFPASLSLATAGPKVKARSAMVIARRQHQAADRATAILATCGS